MLHAALPSTVLLYSLSLCSLTPDQSPLYIIFVLYYYAPNSCTLYHQSRALNSCSLLFLSLTF